MTAADYIKSHWLEWGGAGVAGVLVWLITYTIAKPLLDFWDDRRRAIEILGTDGAIGWGFSEQQVSAARAAVRQAAARFAYYADAGAPVVRIYCRLRGYDLKLAGTALRGLGSTVGQMTSNEVFGRQTDAVRVCLGATRAMSSARVKEIRRIIQASQGSSDRK